jgi:hypothetical protein
MNVESTVAMQVICDSCRRSFVVPDQIGDSWHLCPFCEKLNPRARQKMQKAPRGPGTFVGFLGLVFLVPGIFGAIFGAFFCVFAINNGGLSLAMILLISSVLFIVAGSLFIHADSEAGFRKVGWQALWVAISAVVVGICGWIVVLHTCSGGF